MIGLIGFGRIGRKLAEAIAKKNQVMVVVHDWDDIQDITNVRFTNSLQNLTKATETIVLATQPLALDSLSKDLEHLLTPEHNLVSVMNSTKISILSDFFPRAHHTRIMTNIFCLSGPVAYYPRVQRDKTILGVLFNESQLVAVESESDLDEAYHASTVFPTVVASFYDKFRLHAAERALPDEIAHKFLISGLYHAIRECRNGESERVVREMAPLGSLAHAIIAGSVLSKKT